jgi:glutamine synthetase
MTDPAVLTDELIEKGVEFVFGWYVDVHGVPKSKCVPVRSLPSMAAGSELYTVGALEGMGTLGPHEDECVALPELDRLIILPWNRRFAAVPAELTLHGERYPQESRNVLRGQVEAACAAGFIANVGIEPELYVLRDEPDGWKPLVATDTVYPPTRGYDLESTILADPFIGPMAQHMNALDWDLYSFDHEGGNGQYEFNFGYSDAITTADRMVLFRLMAKHVARELGCIATFMPKPFQDDFGSAAHINISLAHPDSEENAFRGEDDTGGYSDLARHFVAGVLAHAGAINAVVCPTVNSYKRFTSQGHMDDISWAPVYRAWGENNRTLMCRMPANRHCLEVRTADSAMNYHLGIAIVLAAGLDGITRRLNPGQPINEDTYKFNNRDTSKYGDISLPRSLDDALDEFETDEIAKTTFGKEFHTTYLEYKRREAHDYRIAVTDWEVNTYLQRI